MQARLLPASPAKVIMSHIMRTRSGIGVRDANWEVDLLCKLGVLRRGGLLAALLNTGFVAVIQIGRA